MNSALSVAMRTTITITLLLAAAPTAAQPTSPPPTGEAITIASKRAASQCEELRKIAQTATRQIDREQAAFGTQLMCECMPAQLQVAASSIAANTSSVNSEAIFKVAFESCGVKFLRDQMVSSCPADAANIAGLRDATKYCQCVKDEIERTSDAQILDDSKRAARDFDERVKERARGDPPRPRAQTVMDHVRSKCRATND